MTVPVKLDLSRIKSDRDKYIPLTCIHCQGYIIFFNAITIPNRKFVKHLCASKGSGKLVKCLKHMGPDPFVRKLQPLHLQLKKCKSFVLGFVPISLNLQL